MDLSSDCAAVRFLSDVFESLIAAIYFDGGIEAARHFVESHLGPEIESAGSGENGCNYKSQLQLFAQREYGSTPNLSAARRKRARSQQVFQNLCPNRPRPLPACWGRNKKEAEQRAARNALSQITAKRSLSPSD